MLEILLVAVYVLPVISAANLVDKGSRFSPLLTILTLGLVNISGLWRLCAVAVRRLSFAEAPTFDPSKPVHRTAAFLMILGFLLISMQFLTEDLASEGESLAITLSEARADLVGTGALHLAAAFMGAGWLMRRPLPAALRRLCLRRPTRREAAISIAVGVSLWMLSTAALEVWEQAVPADVFKQQTDSARQFYQAFSGSLVSALLLAVVPAVSEEIFYRGALQPVFGLFLTSLFFSAVHVQYGLTPALLILFAVSLGFAGLRLRFHTSAAIIAHAVFNFLPYLAGA
ncbi:MAG: CPBP family intramembrane metalloprotease [Chloroflexota bacterium]|nr:CPBP family intramembrane metalloprotease [Chloroflexota bacterium]